MERTGAFGLGDRLDGGLPADVRASASVDFAERRAAVADCIAALRDLREALVCCPNGEVAGLASELAELRALAGAGLVAVTAEAESRGIVAESQYASTSAWVAGTAWYSRRESSTIAKAAGLFRDAVLEPVAGAVETCDVDLGSAVVVAAEFAKLAPDLVEAAKPIVLESMLDVAVEGGPASVRRLKDEILARYGDYGEFEEHEERLRRHVELSIGRRTAGGMWDYRLVLDPESRAVLEAVIGPGSAPRPNRESGARDSRSVGRRRGEALTDALRRSVTATAQVPTSPKATLMVTMKYTALRRALHGSLARKCGEVMADSGPAHSGANGGSAVDLDAAGGSAVDLDAAGGNAIGGIGGLVSGGIGGLVLGSLAGDTLLSPATVRRLACDASIIPTVLGGDGEILDQGRALRLFNTAQVRTLWQRDKHCTFTGCDVPASWCDAHHLIHWIDGGETTVGNAALLCARHHTVVHRDRLYGQLPTVGALGPPGSYGALRPGDAEKARRRAERGSALGLPDRGGGSSLGQPDRGAGKVIWDLRPGSYDLELGAQPRAA